MLGHLPPKITLAIPTLNEECRIERCLEAIRNQEYPQNLIEIIVADGGSTDRTIEKAKKYGCRIIYNQEKLAEPGLAKAYIEAKGDYVVFMATDNILFDKLWLCKMIKPFLDNPEDIVLSFSKVINDPNDNVWNKYINEDQEPFSAFVFGNASHPDKYGQIYKKIREGENYSVYNFIPDNYPLIALAQGTIMKANMRRSSTQYDDIAPVIDIIKSGKNIAYVTDTGLYHYSFNGLLHVYRKFNSRIRNSFKTKSFSEREKHNNTARKLRKYLFIVYGFSFLFPLIDGIRMSVHKKRIYMILHPIVVFIIAYLIIKNYITIMFYEKA